MSIYQEIILDHYRSPRNFKPLVKADASVVVNNPLCGDRLQLDISVGDGKVNEVGFSGDGCAISLASASLLSEYIKGKKVEDLKVLRKEKVIELLGIDLSPNRIKCALLSWEAVLKVTKKV